MCVFTYLSVCVFAYLSMCMCVLTCLSVCVCTLIYVYMYFLCPCASLMFSYAIKFQVASTGATRWQTLLLGRKNRGGAKAFAPSGAHGSHTYLPYLKGKRVLQTHHLEWLKVCSRDSPHLPRRMSDCEILGNQRCDSPTPLGQVQ